jgi:hypothetical protein
MLIGAFKALGLQFAVIASITALSALLVQLVNGSQPAMDLLNVGVAQMKGPWVWTFGWGLASFIARRGPLLTLHVNAVFDSSDAVASATARIERATRHRAALRYTIPITALGILLTIAYRPPVDGLSYAIVFALVCSIYYVGGFLLFHFLEVTLAFDQLLNAESSLTFRRVYSPLHLEHLTTYLALTTAIGLLGIYAGFRGTLTTSFQFQHEVWRSFLVVPIVLFLPGTLFYNYYPRYVLRKILQHKVFETMERLCVADDASARTLVLDLKETAALNSQILPFLDYKSLPAYLLAIFFGISLAYNSDPAVKNFVGYLLSLGSPPSVGP